MTMTSTAYTSLNATIATTFQDNSVVDDMMNGHATGSEFGSTKTGPLVIPALLSTDKFAFDTGQVQPSFILDISSAASGAITTDTGSLSLSETSDTQVAVEIDNSSMYTVKEPGSAGTVSGAGNTLFDGVAMKDIKGAQVTNYNYAYIYTATSVTAVNLDSMSSEMASWFSSDSDDSTLSSVINDVAGYLKSTYGHPGADTESTTTTDSSGSDTEIAKQTAQAEVALARLNENRSSQNDMLRLFEIPTYKNSGNASSTSNSILSTNA